MSKNAIQIKSAIQNLNIKKPYDLRTQMRPTFQPPKEPEIEVAKNEDPQNEPTQIVETEKRVAAQGFFMLAHSVFENETIRALSGDAFRIFIWMSARAWQFKESNGHFRAAVDYISLKCGCSRSTVSRGLADLKKNHLIECVEQNFKKGNLWKVSRLADGRIEDAEKKHAHPGNEAPSKSGGSISNLSGERAQNEQHLRISSNKINHFQEAKANAEIALKEKKERWEKFCEVFPSPEQQETEIKKLLEGLPFPANQQFAKEIAVMKWFEAWV